MNNFKLPETPHFPNISRYTRWLNEMEEKERMMSPEKRLHKWVILISVLFLLFVASFFLFPAPKISHQSVNPLPEPGLQGVDSLKKERSLTFDMPVDSFEQYLKKEIHEKLPE
ncbi:MAG: hypothetical protein GZ094_04895 [Mariniphaga sp.]|nr:hypothetical protein [Mariniphaga sp.]